MARILKTNYQKIEIECDCGNTFYGIEGDNGLLCERCGNFYEVVLSLCPEHMSK